MITSTGEISSRPAAATHLTRVCFKLGPPRLIGAELEWFTRVSDRTSHSHSAAGRLTAESPRPDPRVLAAALGQHAPTSIEPNSPSLPLRSGSIVSVEPGGQVELSSAPESDVPTLRRSLTDDEHQLRDMLSVAGIEVVAGAADGVRPPERLLTTERYRAMEASFARGGIFGRLMMCNTAAVQVAFDAGIDVGHAVSRWTLLHTVGPALIAAFANSPELHGASDERWASQRMRTWLTTDRTRIPPPAQTVDDYTDWVLDIPLLCVRCADNTLLSPPDGATLGDWMDGHLDEQVGRRPTADDLDYHVTTIFPMVRPKGYLEVRYLDGQPDGMWGVPIAALAALMSGDAVADAATRIAAPTADSWVRAARCGLDDAELRAAATALLELAADATATPAERDELGAASARCAAGQMPSREEPDPR